MITITSDTLLLHTDRHARVTAGPGAGKTYWLVQHTTNILKRSTKLHPHARLGVISYTNVAADSLREKLGPHAARADVGTIHSFLYHNVIKPYLYLVKKVDGQPAVNTQLVDGHDEHHVNHQKMEAWITGINYRTVLRDKGQMGVLKEVLATIHWVQGDHPGAWHLALRPPQWLSQQLWRPTRAKLTPENLLAYKTLYWADGILDHDDILYFATHILHDHPVITECLSARYPFLFIDEFQDTVPAQTQIVRWLAEKHTTVVVIGDAEQSIFAFAGARPEHFREFTLPNIDAYRIADNRRSTNRIIALLNHVRRDGLTQCGVRAQEGSPVILFVGHAADAAQRARTLILENESLLLIARNDVIVQQAQQPAAAPAVQPWDAIEQADPRRKILLHQLLAGVILARARRYDVAITTILRGIRHNNEKLKEPFKTDVSQSALQRRAIAITLLEALIQPGDALDAKTLREAYELCNTTITSSFPELALKAIRGGAFATLADQMRCGTLLHNVRLTNNEEVRDARTIHKAKSTERNNVLVCLHGRNDGDTQEHLNHILHPAPTSDEEQRITYVALSRARDRLFLATPTLTLAQEHEFRDLGITVTRLH